MLEAGLARCGKRKILCSALLLVVATGVFCVAGGQLDRLKRTGNCYWQLEDIDIAKQYWALDNSKTNGSPASLSDLVPKYLTAIPHCPEGGNYDIGEVGAEPTCSHTGRWHKRQFFLNYASPSLIIGKRVYFDGISRNGSDGAHVGNGQEDYLLQAVNRWSFVQTGRKVSVYGNLINSSGAVQQRLVIAHPQWEFRWTRFDAADACLNRLRQIDGAKQQWGLEHHKTAADTPTMEDLLSYIKPSSSLSPYPRCDSGGVYIVGKISESPRCTLHKTTLDNL